MLDFKVYDSENKPLNFKDFDLSSLTLANSKLINTGAIIDAKCVKGAILSIVDNNGKNKVVVFKSKTPLSIMISE